MSGKYVPPHLRNRDGGRNNSGARSNPPAASSDGTSSRWANANSTARDPPRHQSQSSRPASSNNSGASRNNRWGNVDLSTPAQAPSSSRNQHHSKFGHKSSSHTALFFGDSFVKMFGLLKDNPQIYVRGFRGASAKGLAREGNENRQAISEQLASPRSKHVKRIVFCYGSVDVHMSYYYMKYVKGEDIDLAAIAEQYVDFVADLDVSSPSAEKIILGVYFSPLEDEKVGPSLASYGSITEDQVTSVAESEDAKLKVRQKRVVEFNRILAKRCEERGITYQDINDEMNNLDTMCTKEVYRDVSNHNIHVVWETTLLLWLDKWPWLKQMTPPGFMEGLQGTLQEYLKTKPWAEKTHVAETVGVENAVHDT